ncbi:MAG: divalent-cation tolerance protein CutA [Cyanobacteria bacterium P01_F01_bin.53]
MSEQSAKTPFAVVLTTAGSQSEAEAIAAALIDDQLAACVSVFPMQSMYTWEGKVQHDAEWQLVIKTRLACFEAIAHKVKALHSYETPELIALPIVAGSAEYLGWMGTQVKGEFMP